MDARAPAVTVVIPTYNESENVRPLVERLGRAFDEDPFSVVFVDDSDDATPAAIREVAATSGRSVELIHRPRGERAGGLAGAVTAGLRAARTDLVLVMDGDLQHPPEMAPVMRDAAAGVDVAVASRYLGGGDASGLSDRYRHLVSRASTSLARGCFPVRVGRVCTDPMTGFFCLRRSSIDLERLQPRGFKILLEILARHDLDVVEVPFAFGQRASGESKAGWRNGATFLAQMLALRMGRMSRFAAVGALGTLLNLALMAALVHGTAGMGYLAASIIATEVSIVTNFALQERFVFGDLRASSSSWTRRFLQQLTFNNLETVLRLPVLVLLVQQLGTRPVLAQALTLAAAFVARYLFVSRVVYRQEPSQHGRRTALPTPPSDAEKRSYLAAGQGRWIFVAASVALAGIAVSYAGFAAQRYWLLVFFGPLALLLATQAISVWTSMHPRRVTLPDHSFLVETWTPPVHPSVDVFLPTAGEDVELLRNTYSYVAALEWPGTVSVHVLDDAGRDEVAVAAREHGFGYLAREGSEFKKAGNLNHAYERTANDLVLILDADFVPRPDALRELVPYFDEPTVGIVQSPQYFATDEAMGWLERTAAATQELFYRQIQASRDVVGAAICVGTSALYRRSALDAIGGFPLIGHSEDVYTGIRMARAGYQLQYVPTNVTRGLCPTDVSSFIGQQYRWCSGSMALVGEPEFHTETSMTLQQRLCFWSGFLYYVSTALTAVLAPLPMLIMVALFPQQIHPANMLPLLGTVVLWFVLMPAVSLSRWRIEVLRAQTVYGFAHLFSVLDTLRGDADDWVATGSSSSTRASTATRVRRFMTPYLLLTQAATAIFLAVDVARYGVGEYWANGVLFLIGAYVLVPAALLGRPGRSAGEAPEVDLTFAAPDVVDLTGAETTDAARRWSS